MERVVVANLGAEIGQMGGPVAPIDRRLKLARCPETLQVGEPAMGAIAVRCNSLGWRIRVPLMQPATAPRALTAAAPVQVAAEPVIRRGDMVELIAGGAYFSVSTQGIAEQDGAVGARIRVKTDPKKPPVIGEVEREGVVRVPGA